ncbi:MAG: molecular chaperone HtpG [Oscillospiraceae bacterium]|nr:molecular chaperone HtpG [Oscillospiraceae bacterium]
MARTKQFKAESKKLLDMMINSIYTHKEIFLRELISNASDAMDKMYFLSLTDENVKLNRDDFRIKIALDKANRTITITDNGIGMSEEELETNLGTIAKSGSFDFKQDNEKQDNVDIIGQFGVGFYSAFMVSKKVIVESLKYGESAAHRWISEGAEGYRVEECDKADVGTKIILYIKDNYEEENFDEYVEQYTIQRIIKKYSDFIRYPIVMDWASSRKIEGEENKWEDFVEERTINSMVPLWKKDKKEITKEDYENFYSENFHDYNKPLKEIHYKVEGSATYNALLYIPETAPHNYYGRDFKKGLQLYSSGVLIMDKCEDLLPDHFGFVKGLVDSEDLSLNISREMLQHDRQLKIIATNIEKKIKNELVKPLKDNREGYEAFFKNFGLGLKFGIYNSFGVNREMLEDLIMFTSSHEKKPVTLAEYVDRCTDVQENIYYACGETVDKIDMLPQTELAKEKGFEILYMTEPVDEFVAQILAEYKGKKFVNISGEDFDLSTEDEKAQLSTINEENKDMFAAMKEALADSVENVRFTHKLRNHPVCLVSEGDVSIEMQKVLNSLPNNQGIKAQLALEINKDHAIAAKLKELYSNDKDTLAKYAKVLYAQARLIEGLPIENPTELTDLICEIIVK